LHASATHQDVAEFVPTIVTERLGGNLDEGDRQALEAYVSRGVPRLQGPSVDAGRAERGRTAFERVCSGCHAGSEMTSGVGANLHDVGTATATANAVLGPYFESILPEKDAELLRLVRGDRALGPDDPLQLLLDFRPRPARPRGRFKALSLTNVWDNVLFFHDGSRDSLLGAIHYMNEQQQLGLGAADEDDIEAYLKTR
jgi:cytochrome c peroxidase